MHKHMFVTKSNGKELKIYFDLTETTFKERHWNYKTSFNNRGRMKDTELSKYTWSLKDQSKTQPIVEKVNSRANTELISELIFFLIK